MGDNIVEKKPNRGQFTGVKLNSRSHLTESNFLLISQVFLVWCLQLPSVFLTHFHLFFIIISSFYLLILRFLGLGIFFFLTIIHDSKLNEIKKASKSWPHRKRTNKKFVKIHKEGELIWLNRHNVIKLCVSRYVSYVFIVPSNY